MKKFIVYALFLAGVGYYFSANAETMITTHVYNIDAQIEEMTK